MAAALVAGLVALASRASAQGVGNGVSKVTYATNDPAAGHKFLLRYLNVSNATDECAGDVCDCSYEDETWQVQQGRVFTSTPGCYECEYAEFGLHLVNTSAHWTRGGLTVAEVEAIVDAKLGRLASFDAWLDFSVVIYLADLDATLARFDADGVDYFPFFFPNPTGLAGEWSGVFARVPESQMTLELVGSSATLRARDAEAQAQGLAATRRLEQRLSAKAARRALAYTSLYAAKGYPYARTGMLALAARRAASDIASVEAFYAAMNASTVLTADARGAKGRCFSWLHSEVDVCFVERAPNATSGAWTVSDMEQMLDGAHRATIAGQHNCGRDKWSDHHYAYDATATSELLPSSGDTIAGETTTVQEGDFDYILDYLEAHPQASYVCYGRSVHYVYDPTGWAIQLNVNFSRVMTGCDWRDANVSGYDFMNFCYNGYCDAYDDDDLAADAAAGSPPSSIAAAATERAALAASFARDGDAPAAARATPAPLGVAAVLLVAAVAWARRRRRPAELYAYRTVV